MVERWKIDHMQISTHLMLGLLTVERAEAVSHWRWFNKNFRLDWWNSHMTIEVWTNKRHSVHDIFPLLWQSIRQLNERISSSSNWYSFHIEGKRSLWAGYDLVTKNCISSLPFSCGNIYFFLHKMAFRTEIGKWETKIIAREILEMGKSCQHNHFFYLSTLSLVKWSETKQKDVSLVCSMQIMANDERKLHLLCPFHGTPMWSGWRWRWWRRQWLRWSFIAQIYLYYYMRILTATGT